jgi:hypothetical protein
LIGREGGREGGFGRRVEGNVLRQVFMVTRRSLRLFKARGVAIDAAVLTILLGKHEKALPLLTLEEGGSGLAGAWSELRWLLSEMRRSVDLEGGGVTMEGLLEGLGEGEVEEGNERMRDEQGTQVNVSGGVLLVEGPDDAWEQGEEECVGDGEWEEEAAEEDDACWDGDDDM